MAYTSTLSSKSQITVPKAIRDRLGVGPGDRVEFVVRKGRTEIIPVHEGENPFIASIGIVGGFPGGVAEVNAWVRSLREDEG